MVSQATFAGELFPKILVVPAPLKPYVDEILRGHGKAAHLLRPGQDAHDFALSPSQAKALDAADILIVSDLGMTPVLRILASNKKKLRVIELSKLEGASPRPYPEENPFLTALKEAAKETPKPHVHSHHSSENVDPHLWLDPERMAAIAPALAQAISQTTPEATFALKTNAEMLAQHLRTEVTPQLRAILSKAARTSNALSQPEIPFITYHAAYHYFMERFNLTHWGEITLKPEKLIGTKTMLTLLQQANRTRVRCLIGEQHNSLMQRVASSTGAKIVILSPEQLVARDDSDALDWLKNDYDRFLYTTAKAFAGCL